MSGTQLCRILKCFINLTEIQAQNAIILGVEAVFDRFPLLEISSNKKNMTPKQQFINKIKLRYALARKNDPVIKELPAVVAQRLKYTAKSSPKGNRQRLENK